MTRFNHGKASPLVNAIAEMGLGFMMNLDQTILTSEHILGAIFQTAGLRRYFGTFGVNCVDMVKDITTYLNSQGHLLKNEIPKVDDLPQDIIIAQYTEKVLTLFENAQKHAEEQKREILISDLLLKMLEDKSTYASYFMRKYGVTEQMIEGLNTGGGDKGPSLEDFCVNLNEKVKTESDPLIGREPELFSMAQALSKKKKCNCLLIGEPGVGKTMIVEGLAQRINSGDVPKTLKDKIIYYLNVGDILAGCKLRGEFEEKIKFILNEIIQNPKAILFIDEAEQMDAGEGKGQAGIGFSTMFKPELSRGRLKVIANTTWEGYRSTFEKDSSLMRRFRVIKVGEPSAEETLEILRGSRPSMEKFHSCKIEDSALDAAVELTTKYQLNLHLPDKAIDILDSACARNRVQPKPEKSIKRSHIEIEIKELTGHEVKSETNENSKELLTISDKLKNKVFHQEAAINKVSESLIVSGAGLKDPNRPTASFLFLGPSGCGKTLLSKQIAANMGMDFIRFDMSEYQEKHSLAKLIGAPPGYVGFGDGQAGEGMLVNEIIKKPNSVILFDEIEKAHPDVSTVFLQLLDEGRVTGSTSKSADARNCMIIMSSNLGTSDSKENLGFNDRATGKSRSIKAAEKFFLTELRGRVTDIIEFNALDDLSYRRIILESIDGLGKLIHTRNLTFRASEELVSHILKLNNSSAYGARRINSLVESIIKYPLSVELLKGNIQNNSNVSLDWKDEKLVISPIIFTLPVEKVVKTRKVKKVKTVEL